MTPEACQSADTASVEVKSTLRQRSLVKGLAEGLSIAAAGRQAGYSDRQAARESFVNMRDRLMSKMDKAGLTEDVILARLYDQMWATRTVHATAYGEITDTLEIADNAAIGKAVDTAARMRRMIDSDDGRTSIGTVNVLFAGALPDWTDPVGRTGVGTSPVPVQANDGSKVVHTGDSEGNAPPPLSTVEGTGPGPGGIGHTNLANVDGINCVNTPSVPVQAVPVTAAPAKSKLSSRVVKKRVARLPVYRP